MKTKASHPKRALLSYLVPPLALPPDYHLAFSNAGIVRSWVQVLTEMAYLVDVVNWDNVTIGLRVPYDLFVGHGGINWSHLSGQLPVECVKIYFAAGTPWQEHNQAEAARFDDLERRRGIRLPPDRRITHEETTAYREADGIICLGNWLAGEEYAIHHSLVRSINCGVYPDTHFDPSTKDFKAGRSRFLFFSGWGNVHKGLDLLLEAFAGMPEAELYIATSLEGEFAVAYRKELTRRNIHVMGWVPLKEKRFYELVDHCDWIILPSCAEGQPGSVLECMNQGLVPIVTRACHLDVGLGLTLGEVSRDGIREAVGLAIFLKSAEIEWAAHAAHTIAQEQHSPEAFRHGLRRGVEEIIAARASRRQHA
jgi:glycosyltransferase involved in cell wall biosynthesis